jgi:hypothetical protein
MAQQGTSRPTNRKQNVVACQGARLSQTQIIATDQQTFSYPPPSFRYSLFVLCAKYSMLQLCFQKISYTLIIQKTFKKDDIRFTKADFRDIISLNLKKRGQYYEKNAF